MFSLTGRVVWSSRKRLKVRRFNIGLEACWSQFGTPRLLSAKVTGNRCTVIFVSTLWARWEQEKTSKLSQIVETSTDIFRNRWTSANLLFSFLGVLRQTLGHKMGLWSCLKPKTAEVKKRHLRLSIASSIREDLRADCLNNWSRA